MSSPAFTPGPWHDNAFGPPETYMPSIVQSGPDQKLATAAPDLYAALAELLAAEWMVTHDWGGDRDGVKTRVDAALAKARGEHVK